MTDPGGPAAVKTELGARERAADVYGAAMEASRLIFRTAQPEAVPAEENAPAAKTLPLPRKPVADILALLQSGDQEILALADRSASDHFLFGHAVNVTIYALRLGMALELPREELASLGVAGFLHDLGLAGHMELAAKPAKLTDAEVRTLQTHLRSGEKLLDLFDDWPGDLKALTRRVIVETHQRQSGPSPDSADIHPFAKILSLCEIYEALTHMRPWRARTVPHEVLRSFVEDNPADIDPGLVRAFVETLSLYPPGSFVRLSTGEVGRVMSTTPGLPLRPKVWVMIDAAGKRAAGTRILNLAIKPSIYITDAVDETKIRTQDQKLALALKAQRWWLRGL